MAVECISLGQMRMLEEIRRQGDEAGERLFFSFLGRERNQVEAEKFVGVGEVVSGK